jgi:hypothetical protein
MLLQGIPFFLTNYREFTLTRFYYPIYWDHLFLYLLCIPIFAYVELSVLLFLIEGAKHYLGHKPASGVITLAIQTLLLLIALVVVVYHLVIAASWFYYSQTGYFLGLDMLNLFPMLFDFRYIAGTFAPLSLLKLFLVLMISVLLGFWVVIFAPRRNYNDFVRKYGRRTLFSLLMAFVLAVLPVAYLPPQVSGVYRANSFFALSPQWSLLWAYLRYGRFEPKLPTVPLNLIKHRGLDFALAKQIPNKNKHVFLFVVEALRADVVDPSLTPTLYRLAREGVNFDNSYSQSTETSESMLSIITGRYPLRSPLRSREVRDRVVFHVYDGLARAGYATGYIGEEWSQDSILTNSPDLSYRFNPLTADYSSIDSRDNPLVSTRRVDLEIILWQLLID